MNDESFLNRFRADPEAALNEYELDEEERDALVNGTDRDIRETLGDAKTIGVAVVVWVADS